MYLSCAATNNDEIVADLMTFFEEWLFSHFEFHYAPVRHGPPGPQLYDTCRRQCDTCSLHAGHCARPTEHPLAVQPTPASLTSRWSVAHFAVLKPPYFSTQRGKPRARTRVHPVLRRCTSTARATAARWRRSSPWPSTARSRNATSTSPSGQHFTRSSDAAVTKAADLLTV